MKFSLIFFFAIVIIWLLFQIFTIESKEPPCYTEGWKNGYERALKQYNIPIDQDKGHEGYTLDSLNAVRKYGWK